MDKRIKEATEEWLPDDINAIPLQVWDPSDNQIVVYQGADTDTGGATDILMLSDAGSLA